MTIRNKLIGGLAAIVLSASSFSTQAQNENLLKFKDIEPNTQLYLKFKPEEIIQTPPKKLKYHDTNVIIYNIPKIEDDNSFFIPEPEKKRNYEKYDKLRCEPSKGDYQ